MTTFYGYITLYVLELDNNRYYIGMTTDIVRRYNEHMSGKGCWFTAMYKPIRILELQSTGTKITSEAALLESKLAAKYVIKYGIDNVRGGAFIKKKVNSRHLARWLKRYSS